MQMYTRTREACKNTSVHTNIYAYIYGLTYILKSK